MNIFFLDKLNDYNKLLKNGEIPHIKLTEVLDYSIDHMQERVIDMPMIERTLNTITSGKKIIDHMLELCYFAIKSNEDFNDDNQYVIIEQPTKKQFVLYEHTADELEPYPQAVTTFDKTVLLFCSIFRREDLFVESQYEKYVRKVILDLFDLFFVKLQHFEYRKKCTFNCECLSKVFPDIIQNIICEKYDLIQQDLIIPINDDEFIKLEDLLKKRQEATNSLINNRTKAKEFINLKQSEEAWHNFVLYVNELSAKDEEIIHCLGEIYDVSEKEKALEDYFSYLFSINYDRKCNLEGVSIDLDVLYENITERFTKAYSYCALLDENGNEFIPLKTITELLNNPISFTFYLALYHYLRINPNEYAARSTVIDFEIALKNQLDEDDLVDVDPEDTSIKEALFNCSSIIFEFYEKHVDEIEKLSLDHIADRFNLEWEDHDSYLDNIYEDRVNQETKKYFEQNQSLFDELYDYDNGYDLRRFRHFITSGEAYLESIVEQEYHNASAEIFVANLNLIFLLCEVIKILLDHKEIEAGGVDFLKNMLNGLHDIERRVARIVYNRLPIGLDLSDYRQQRFIDSHDIEKKEIAYEKDEMSFFFRSVLSDSHELFEQIFCSDISSIMQIFSDLRAKSLRIINKDDRIFFQDWLDSHCMQICDRIIFNANKQKDEFENEKEQVVRYFGPKQSLLPAQTIDALTTAELLFKRYNSSYYINSSFDYSCISALYYQAVEASYNLCLWKDYAAMLNGLELDGKTYSEILWVSKQSKVYPEKVKGYLCAGDERKYIHYKELLNRHLADEQCMMKNFADLMRSVSEDGEVLHFYDYLATKLNYSDTKEMFNNDFVQKCITYSIYLECAVKNRNKASHGGEPIRIEECVKDREIVIPDIGRIRKQSLGLIEMLLDLYA